MEREVSVMSRGDGGRPYHRSFGGTAGANARLQRRIVLGVLALLAALALLLALIRLGSSTLTLPEHVRRDYAEGGTWREMFDLRFTDATATLAWILALVVAGAVGLPYAWLAGRNLPDRGFAVARVLGLLLVTLAVWWLASIRVLPFTRVAILLAGVLVAAGAGAIAVRHRLELAASFRSHWRVLAVAEAVFWLVFAAALFARWSNPDLWHPLRGGEKPMDFAYLNAVAKSTYFPPFDPWFAGGQMNYYYLGFVQVATLAKATGIPPSIAYNLAIPTLAALLASAAFSATFGLASAHTRDRRASVVVAALGAGFATVLGNLGELRVVRSALRAEVPNDWWFWNASRAIRPGEGEPGPITEFPAFTFIYGDLHAHAMALPLAALALALTVALVRTPEAGATRTTCLALLGVTVGALGATNSWDLPTYALVALCGVGLAAVYGGRGRRARGRLIAEAVGVLATSYLALLPFHVHYVSVFEGLQRWQGSQTGLSDYLIVHGLFLFAAASALALQLAYSSEIGSVARSYRLAARGWSRLGRLRDLERLLVQPTTPHRLGVRAVPIAPVAAMGLIAVRQEPTGLALMVATLAALAWPRRRRASARARDAALRALTLVLLLVALGLTVAVEFVVVRGIDIERTNTVFKLYLQVWLLLAVVAAVSVGSVYGRLPLLRRPVRELWRFSFVLLLVGACLYPVLAARAKIRDRFDPAVGQTLDGTAFMTRAVLDDAGRAVPLAPDRDAIRWLLTHVEGSPVIAEANTAPTLYGWQGRYSVHTGNPTIVGWDFHQRQQRPAQSELVQRRVADVQRLFATPDADAAARILARYGARFVVVGPLERAYYPKGIGKWAEAEGRLWTLAYANPGVRIYRVGAPRTR
jgi:YYY domain-containing protein